MFRSSLNRVLDWAERALAWEDPVAGAHEWFGGVADERFGEVDKALGGAAEQRFAEADERAGGAAEDRAGATPPPPHPHRHPLRWERQRRPGSVPHPPAHCISPIVWRSRTRTGDGSAR
jgi:hypothetical protein